jgi:histidinol phosphatase-like enzyme
MEEELRKEGAVIDRIYYCPHDIEDYCGCRKPEPGLLMRAVK